MPFTFCELLRENQHGEKGGGKITSPSPPSPTPRLGLVDLRGWSLQATSDTEMKARLYEIANFCLAVSLIK